jgi:hypothetical protein
MPFAGDPRKVTHRDCLAFITYAREHKPWFREDPSRLTPANLVQDFGAWLDNGRPATAAELRARKRAASGERPEGLPPNAGHSGRRGADYWSKGQYGGLIEM